MILGKKILVLDDEGCIRDLIRETLEEKGYSVITTEDPGTAAVKAHNVDLVILDLSMSDQIGTQGLDVLIHIWENKLNNTPVIIFSAYVTLQEIIDEIHEVEDIYGEGRSVFECVSKYKGIEKLVESVDDLFMGANKQLK